MAQTFLPGVTNWNTGVRLKFSIRGRDNHTLGVTLGRCIVILSGHWFPGVMQKRESPDFRSTEVGISKLIFIVWCWFTCTVIDSNKHKIIIIKCDCSKNHDYKLISNAKNGLRSGQEKSQKLVPVNYDKNHRSTRINCHTIKWWQVYLAWILAIPSSQTLQLEGTAEI